MTLRRGRSTREGGMLGQRLGGGGRAGGEEYVGRGVDVGRRFSTMVKEGLFGNVGFLGRAVGVCVSGWGGGDGGAMGVRRL